MAQPLKSYYPFPNFRPGIEEALKKIDEAVESGKRFIIVDSPTGSGKSSIAVAFARKYKSTIWTPTKILQEQYANTENFDLEYVLKGKSNYNCGLEGQEENSVDEAICCSLKILEDNEGILPFKLTSSKKGKIKEVKNKCANLNICPYYSKLYRISTVPGAIINYDLGLRIKPKKSGSHYTGNDLGERLVLDEAHQLVSKVNSVFGEKISNTSAMRLLGQEGKRLRNEEPVEWLSRLLSIASLKVSKETSGKKVAKYDRFIKKIEGLLALDLKNERKFLIEDKDSEVEIKPLDLRYLKNDIFNPFKTILMLSATFPANFKQVFGISDSECETIKIESTFPKENRLTVFAKDLPNINARTTLTEDCDQLYFLNLIMQAHAKDKGIIHCGNYKIFDQLHGLMKKNKRFIWVRQDLDKEEMLDLHKSTDKPTILVSPAMLEGVDLKDDLARFGVLLKVPYPPLDNYTKKMNAIFSSWYDTLTITNVVQAYGRQVRSVDDKAIFYILDGSFNIILNKSKKIMPKYFIESLKIGDKAKLANVLFRKTKELTQAKSE